MSLIDKHVLLVL